MSLFSSSDVDEFDFFADVVETSTRRLSSDDSSSSSSSWSSDSNSGAVGISNKVLAIIALFVVWFIVVLLTALLLQCFYRRYVAEHLSIMRLKSVLGDNSPTELQVARLSSSGGNAADSESKREEGETLPPAFSSESGSVSATGRPEDAAAELPQPAGGGSTSTTAASNKKSRRRSSSVTSSVAYVGDKAKEYFTTTYSTEELCIRNELLSKRMFWGFGRDVGGGGGGGGNEYATAAEGSPNSSPVSSSCLDRFMATHTPEGWWADYKYYEANNHLFLGMIFCDPLHPMTGHERRLVWFFTATFTFNLVAFGKLLHTFGFTTTDLYIYQFLFMVPIKIVIAMLMFNLFAMPCFQKSHGANADRAKKVCEDLISVLTGLMAVAGGLFFMYLGGILVADLKGSGGKGKYGPQQVVLSYILVEIQSFFQAPLMDLMQFNWRWSARIKVFGRFTIPTLLLTVGKWRAERDAFLRSNQSTLYNRAVNDFPKGEFTKEVKFTETDHPCAVAVNRSVRVLCCGTHFVTTPDLTEPYVYPSVAKAEAKAAKAANKAAKAAATIRANASGLDGVSGAEAA